MEINWIIIVVVFIFAILLIAFIITQNQKDKDEVTRHFNDDFSEFTEEDELNNER